MLSISALPISRRGKIVPLLIMTILSGATLFIGASISVYRARDRHDRFAQHEDGLPHAL
jgi:hypothetical protein